MSSRSVVTTVPPLARRAVVHGAAVLGVGFVVPPSVRASGAWRLGETSLDERRMPQAVAGSWDTGRRATAPFRMVAVTWRGRLGATVRVRTRRRGTWSPWQVLRPMEDGPDPAAGEGIPGRRGAHPLWTGWCDGVQVQVSGDRRPDRLRLVLIEPGHLPRDARETASMPAQRASGRRRRRGRAPRPELRSRKDWGADESLNDGDPVMCRTISQVHLHHTASGNDYSRSDVPALIRGFHAYHVRSLGWSDLGYNFLVDRFGRTWVGRAGGPGRPVRGAHTLGFNHTSVGVAVIGNFESHRVPDRVVTAIVQLAAWKLDAYGRRPRGKARVYSKDSDRYEKGWVRLKVIDGHRDTNHTACPGEELYARLPEIRKRTHYHVKRHGRR